MINLARSAASISRPLELARVQSARRASDRISRLRDEVLTPTHGQSEVYREKERQAEAYLALATPRPDPPGPEFWALEFEGAAFGSTPQAAAEMIMNAAARTRGVIIASESARRIFQAALIASVDVIAVSDAERALEAALRAIADDWSIAISLDI